MPLAPVNFKDAESAYPVIPVPMGQTLDVEGLSKTWEPVATADGSGVHVLAKYAVLHQMPGAETPRNIEFRVRWSLKPTGLWRTKRDLIALGADPTDFESTAVDLESILNELFSAPHKATLTIKETTYTPKEYDPSDPNSPQPRQQNEVVSIKAA